MPFTLADLVAALDLAPDPAPDPAPDRAGGRGDAVLGRAPSEGWQRVFGGLILAQALVAMTRTAGGRPVHAMHAMFVRPGDPAEPIGYDVARLRDGGSFTARSCTASQHGMPIFTGTASFQASEAGALDHGAAMPEAPAPEDLPGPADPRAGDLPRAARAYFARNAAVEVRLPDAGRPRAGEGGGAPRRRAVWMRAAGALPDEPALHAAVLAYMSDLTLLDTALLAHGRSVFDPAVQAASLDHAIWFHRPVRADGWLLYAEDSPSASGGRGFARGSVFDRAGTLVASTAQEGLIRLRGRD